MSVSVSACFGKLEKQSSMSCVRTAARCVFRSRLRNMIMRAVAQSASCAWHLTEVALVEVSQHLPITSHSYAVEVDRVTNLVCVNHEFSQSLRARLPL